MPHHWCVQALFRVLEPSLGTIYIDGLDITRMGLADLRSRLSVVPQARPFRTTPAPCFTAQHAWCKCEVLMLLLPS